VPKGKHLMQAEPLTPAFVQDAIRRHWTGRAAAYDEDTRPRHDFLALAQSR
jgi:hypothetical protein